MNDFKDIAYLKEGNPRQIKAFNTINDLNLFNKLKSYTPVLTGTVPIEIDIDDSDLDIICYCKDLKQFKDLITDYLGIEKNFSIQEKTIRDHITIVARFDFNGFLIEIFGQDRPVDEQEAYRHMIIEYKVLLEKGEDFRNQIIELKKQGLKTEPAFAKLLGLKGNPYDELLKI